MLVSPYLLKEYNRRWYIIAGAQDTGRILNFALDRLVAVDVKPGLHYKPCEEDLTDRFDEIIGVTYNTEKPLTQILLWASDEVKGFIHTKPLHGSQRNVKVEIAEKLHRLYPSLEGGDFFTIECRENMELIRELTAWGAGLLVLTPVSLRETIINLIKEMTSNYESFA